MPKLAPLSAESLTVFCAPGYRNKKKKRSFRALRSTHLPPSLYPDGSCVAQPWLSPSRSLSWVKQVFFSTYFILKPLQSLKYAVRSRLLPCYYVASSSLSPWYKGRPGVLVFCLVIPGMWLLAVAQLQCSTSSKSQFTSAAPFPAPWMQPSFSGTYCSHA